jgi:hypothetical protein
LVQDLGFREKGLWFRVEGLRFIMHGLGSSDLGLNI